MLKDDSFLIKELEIWGAEPKQVLTDTFMGDAGFYKECLIKFMNEDYLTVLKESIDPVKKDTAVHAVHTMKGNSDYLGLFPITDAAVSVLIDLRNDELDQAAVDLPELEMAFDQFCKIMKPYLA